MKYLTFRLSLADQFKKYLQALSTSKKYLQRLSTIKQMKLVELLMKILNKSFVVIMMETRNKRIKTDFSRSQHNQYNYIVKLHEDQHNMPKRVSTLENRQNQICMSRDIQPEYYSSSINRLTMNRSIKKPFKKKEITQEALHKKINKSTLKRNYQQKAFEKGTIASEMGLNYGNLCKQTTDNQQIVDNLKAEYEYLNQKLDQLSHPDVKLNEVIIIQQSEDMARKMRRQIEKIRKNKFLRQREIVKGKLNQSSELQQLQRQYITLAKKEQQLLERVQIIQQQIIDSDMSLIKQKQYYREIKDEVSKIPQAKSQNMKQHLQIIYKSHKKQLQINFKKQERQDETLKKKYYQLLKDYQHQGYRQEEIDNKIFIVDKQNQEAINKIKYILNKRERIKTIKEQQASRKKVFMLSELQSTKKHYLSEKKKISLDIEDDRESSAQRKLNTANANIGHIVRRLNFKRENGAIVKQSLSSSIARQKHSEDIFGSNNQLHNYKNNPASKQIRHFRTESAQVFDQQYLTDSRITFIEEVYQEDFES